MRTTVTLDPDVEALLKNAMRERDASFKPVLNVALREGLSLRAGRAATPFEQMTFDMGPLLLATGNLNSLADELEDRELIAKLARGR
jgi:hypothetical protein